MSKEKDPNYIQNLWRPMMGWMYMLICLLDMAVFPVLWSILQAVMHQPITQWNPLTLQGAGLFHIAMGAVLGISAFGRTQEKLAGSAANPTATTTTHTENITGNVSGGFGSNTAAAGGSFGGNNGGFGNAGGFSGGSTFGSAPTGGFGSAPGVFNATPAPSAIPAPAAPATGFGADTSSAPIATTASGKKIIPTDPDPEI